MSGIHIELGDPLELAISLADDRNDRFPRARVYQNGTEVVGSPFNLSNVAGGYYRNTSYTPIAEGIYTARYEVYSDAGYTNLRTQYGFPTDTFEVNNKLSDLDDILADTNALETRLTNTRASNLDNLDATISSREAESDALSRYNGLVSEHNTTQTTLNTRFNNIDNTLGTPDVTIADDIASIQTRVDLLETESDASSRFSTLQTEHNDTQVQLTNLDTKIGTPNSLAGTVVGDIADVQARADLLETESDAASRAVTNQSEHDSTQTAISNLSTKIGAPTALDIATDIANVQSRADLLETEADALSRFNTLQTEHNTTQTNLSSLDTKIGTPTDTDIATDIANVQTRADLLETEADALSRFNALQGTVNNIENNTKFKSNAPSFFEVPQAGSTTYKIIANLFDSGGNPEDPDTNSMTINIKDSSGADIVAATAMTRTSQGIYEYDYVLSDTVTEGEQYIIYFTYAEGGVSFTQTKSGVYVQTVDKLDTLLGRLTSGRASNLDNLDATISSRQSEASALSRFNTVTTEIDANETKIDSVQARADLLETEADALLRFNTLQTEHNDTQTQISTLSSNNQSEHDQTQADIAALDTKIGTPSIAGVTVSGDIANVQARADLLETESDAASRQAALVGEHNTTRSDISNLSSLTQTEHDNTQTQLTNLDTKIGTPNSLEGTIAEDIENVQDRVNILQTESDALSRFNSLTSEHNQTQTDVSNLSTLTQTEHNDTQSDIAALSSKVGTPNSLGGTVVDDISEFRTENKNEHDTTQVQVSNIDTKLGTPTLSGVTVSGDIANVQARADLLETEADASSRQAQLLADHDLTQSKIDDLTSGPTALTLTNIADAVWDEVILGAAHDDPGSAGLLVEVIRQFSESISDELTTSPQSLLNIYTEVTNTQTLVSNENDENEVKLDSLASQLGSVETNLTSEITTNRSDIGGVNTNVNNTRAQIIGEVNANETKIDSLDTKISGIQNNTDIVAIVPERMVVPAPVDSPKTYQLVLETFNDSGQPVDADSTPIVKIYNMDGSVYLAETNMTKDGSKTGVYLYDLDITDSQIEKPIRIEFKTVINAVTKYSQRTSEFVESDTTLATIETKVDTVNTIVSDNNNLLSGANGLAQIKTEVLTNRTEVNANETKIDGIKSVTDALPGNIATQTDTSAIETKVDNVPTNSELTSALNNQTNSIKGIDLRDLTDVYNNERGTENALLSTDPRLDNLDAAISSRSTLTDADVWAYVNRTLTAATPLTTTDAQKVWDILLTSISVPGSVGRLVKDFLDVAVSTRSTLTELQLDTKLAPLATETNVDDARALIQNENNENQILLNSALALLNQIKPQTDKIVSDGAQEGTVVTEANENQSLLNGLSNLVNLVKAKTDNLPSDPAQQSTVNAIPTNTLLNNDPRLDDLSNLVNLDVAVSTRAASFPSDYAKQSDIDAAKTDIISEVNQNEAKINALPTTAYFDAKFSQVDVSSDINEIKGAGFNTNIHSLVDIKEGQATAGGGASITAQDVWEYSDRSLTDYPEFSTPGDVETAKEAVIDELTHVEARMSTTIDSANNKQTVVCWLDINGQTNAFTENARIDIRNGNGTLIWSGADAIPDARGVFTITKTDISDLINSVDNNYSMKITIEYQGQDYSSIQPFYTVG